MLHVHLPFPYDLNDPLEQGGLLLGTHEGETAHAHVITGPQPDDDRGTHHLHLCSPHHLQVAEQASARGLTYLGYWHSHPAGTPPVPSEVDVTDFHVAAQTCFPALPYLDFPIITGGVLKCFRLRHDLTLKEVSTLAIQP